MKRWIYKRFSAVDREKLEVYLNAMAKQNWHLVSMGVGLTFVKKDDCDVYYHVVYDNNNSMLDSSYVTRKSKTYQEFMEEFEYQYICRNQYFHIYSSEKSDSNIYTDNLVDNEIKKQSLKKNMIWFLIAPLLSITYKLIQILNNYQTQLDILADNSQIFVFLVVIISFVYILTLLLFDSCVLLNIKNDNKVRNTTIFTVFLLVTLVITIVLLPELSKLYILSILVILLFIRILTKLFKYTPPFLRYIILLPLLLLFTLSSSTNVMSEDYSSHLSESIIVSRQRIAFNNGNLLDIYKFKIFDDYIEDKVINSIEGKYIRTEKEIEIYKGKDNSYIIIKNNMMIIGFGQFEIRELLSYMK